MTQTTQAPGARIAERPHYERARVTRSYDVADFDVPTGREEEWRFTPLQRLRGLHDGTLQLDGKVLVEVEAADQVTVETIEREHPLVGSVLTPTERVSAYALANFTGGTLIRIQANSSPEPVHVTLNGDGGGALGHLFVDVERGAQAVVVLNHRGTATYAANVEYAVADGASLDVVSLQEWDEEAVHVGHHAARLGRDARFRSVIGTYGGNLVRLSPEVLFTEPGGEVELLGLFLAESGQHLEHRLFVDHAAPNCRSRVVYKGTLQGSKAHTVWIGDVFIRPQGIGTDTYELNRNLVLTDGARADSVPNLEIETGEVRQAGHASATGRFDEQQLFYLQSRGVPREEALRLVVRGFFADVIRQIGVPHLRERVEAEVERELERVL